MAAAGGEEVMQSVDSLNVTGRRILLRADLNVPLRGTQVADGGRIRACLPTITALLNRGAAVVICSHLGRPAVEYDPAWSMAPVAKCLSRMLRRPVPLAADVAGPSARAAAASLQPGGVILLENLRFDPRETSQDPAERVALARQLAGLADAYVGDGFGVLHRRHASVCETAGMLPHAGGYLVQAEVAALQRLTGDIRRPYTLVIGGAKVADKLPVVSNLLKTADEILVGGALALAFLAALGRPAGRAIGEGSVGLARDCLDRAGRKLILPTDITTAASRDPAEKASVVASDAIPADQLGLDIGPEASALYSRRLAAAQTIFWSGPMGVYEIPQYAEGTRIVARALAASTGYTVVGGGDTGAAVRALGFLDSSFSHVSTGGGASLEYLSGAVLPGLEALGDGGPKVPGASDGKPLLRSPGGARW